MNPVPASSGEVTQIDLTIMAPGGGGGDSDNAGTDAGFAYATFTVDGTTYTITSNGGDGGGSGDSGGAGGSGGAFSYPISLDNEDWFVISNNQTGADGDTGGTTGTELSEVNGGGDTGTTPKPLTTGGDGRANSFTDVVDLGTQHSLHLMIHGLIQH